MQFWQFINCNDDMIAAFSMVVTFVKENGAAMNISGVPKCWSLISISTVESTIYTMVALTFHL